MNYHQPITFVRDVALTSAACIGAGLLLATAFEALTPKRANALNAHFRQVEHVVESIGAKVLWADRNTNGCKRNLLGFYSPSKRTVIMCQGNARNINGLLSTLKHEGWHAAQHICNNNRAALTDEQIRSATTPSDRRTILSNYPAHQYRAEAEARVIEQLPVPNYIDGFKVYCTHIL